jgi:hypothetical protein
MLFPEGRQILTGFRVVGRTISSLTVPNSFVVALRRRVSNFSKSVA